MIRVIATVDLPEWWGADDAYAEGGEWGIIELIQEDLTSFLEDAIFTVEKI